MNDKTTAFVKPHKFKCVSHPNEEFTSVHYNENLNLTIEINIIEPDGFQVIF